MNKQQAAALQAVKRKKQGGRSEARLKEWQSVSAQQGFANEFTVSARLGEPAFTQEQADMVSALFGR